MKFTVLFILDELESAPYWTKQESAVLWCCVFCFFLPGSRRWPQSWRLLCWEISLCRDDVSAAAPPPGTARGRLQAAAGTAASCTQVGVTSEQKAELFPESVKPRWRHLEDWRCLCELMNSSRYSLSEVAQKLFGLLWEEMTSSVSLDLQPELNILLLDSDLHIGGVSTHLDLCNLLRLKTQSGLREAEILEFKKK